MAKRRQILPEDLNRFSETCRVLCEKGNKWALMQTIALFAEERQPLPEWAATAFVTAFEMVRRAEVDSWDKVLGKPIKKGAHLNAERKRLELGSNVYNRVREIKEESPKTPTDSELFAMVGKEFGIGKTLAEGYYYAIDRLWSKVLGELKNIGGASAKRKYRSRE